MGKQNHLTMFVNDFLLFFSIQTIYSFQKKKVADQHLLIFDQSNCSQNWKDINVRIEDCVMNHKPGMLTWIGNFSELFVSLAFWAPESLDTGTRQTNSDTCRGFIHFNLGHLPESPLQHVRAASGVCVQLRSFNWKVPDMCHIDTVWAIWQNPRQNTLRQCPGQLNQRKNAFYVHLDSLQQTNLVLTRWLFAWHFLDCNSRKFWCWPQKFAHRFCHHLRGCCIKRKWDFHCNWPNNKKQ